MTHTRATTLKHIAIFASIAGWLALAGSTVSHSQDGDELEQCILQAASAYNTYKECVSQVISYHAANVTQPDAIISFAKRQCGADRERHVRVLAECMGRDVAVAMAESEDADDLLPHLHQLIANAGKQKVHGDLSPPAPDDPFHAPMSFHLVSPARANNGAVIAAVGTITADVAERFSEFIATVDLKPGGGMVRFNSPGGEVLAALAMGDEIRKLGFSTEVETNSQTRPQCVSACVYAFLGGVYRRAAVGHIGVHRFYRELALSDPDRKAYDSNDLAEAQKLAAHLVKYVTRMGAGPEIVWRAANTPADQISYLTQDELIGLKVVHDPPQ